VGREADKMVEQLRHLILCARRRKMRLLRAHSGDDALGDFEGRCKVSDVRVGFGRSLFIAHADDLPPSPRVMPTRAGNASLSHCTVDALSQ